MGKKQKLIDFYPKVDENIIDALKLSIQYEFYYLNFGQEENIPYKRDGNLFVFDKKTLWNFEDYDLRVRIKVYLGNKNVLFGNNGIAASKAKIGIAVEWFSTVSKSRDIIKNNNSIINDIEKSESYYFDFKLKKKSFNGNININILLYLQESAKYLTGNDNICINEEGFLLGNLDEKIINLTGIGSQFPIKVDSLKNNKLWIIQINYNEPEIDQFNDVVCVVLNSKHKDFHYIDIKNKDCCYALLDEIVREAISILLCKLKEDGYLVDLDKNHYVEGSVLNYAWYCKNVFEIDFRDTMSIFENIKDISEKSE